jgi:hypothetical protein
MALWPLDCVEAIVLHVDFFDRVEVPELGVGAIVRR